MNTQLYIDGVKVDLFDDVDIPLTYSIADVREPETRQGTYSKTILIPGTKANNKLFTHLFELGYAIQNATSTNFNPDFNPNLKASCLLTRNEIPILKGKARLLSIQVDNKDSISYEITLIAQIVSFLADVGQDALLEDLDISTYDHTYGYTAIKNSWGATTGYTYPMIDRGLNDLTQWKVEDFLPAVFVKDYVDKMFSAAGWVYESTFLTSDFFKSLIIPSNSDKIKLTESQILNRTFSASLSALNTSTNWCRFDAAAAINNVGAGGVEFDTEVHDAGNVYDSSGYEFTVANNGHYRFQATCNARAKFLPSSPAYLITHIIGTMVVVKNDGTTYSIAASSTNKVLVIGDGTLRNSGDTSSYVEFTIDQELTITAGHKYHIAFVFYSGGKVLGSTFFGDNYSPSHAPVVGTVSIDVQSGATWEVSITDASLFEGETMLMNNTIPRNIKQRDFFSSLIKMFNLYVEQDKDVDNKLLIEPRDDFYTNEILDWSLKRDMDSALIEIPMGDLDFKKFTYSYKSDKDYYNAKHENKYQRVYGDKQITVENDFIDNERKQDVIFSMTPTVNNGANNRFLPTILSQDEQGKTKSIDGNIRILQFANEVDCQTWFLLASSGAVAQGVYPFASHLDSVSNPTVDLCFGSPKEVYYKASIYTDGNLYNRYHKKTIDEITDKDSKIVQGTFYLTPNDLYQVDFRKLYYFDGYYFRLNKMEYSAMGDHLTWCEFVRVKGKNTFTQSQTNLKGQFESDNPSLPSNLRTITSPVIVGKENNVAPSAVQTLVFGDHNNIGTSSNAVLLASSGNAVMADNVVMLNSSGMVVTESGTFINGRTVRPAATLTNAVLYISSGDVRSLNSTPVEIIAAPGDGQIIDIVSSMARSVDGPDIYSWSGSGTIIGLRMGNNEILSYDTGNNFLISSGNQIAKGIFSATAQPEHNTSVELFTDGTFNDGNGYIIIDILYRILNL